jgi:hypothetical protein
MSIRKRVLICIIPGRRGLPALKWNARRPFGRSAACIWPTTRSGRRALSLLIALPLLAGALAAQGNLKYGTAGVTGVTLNFLVVEDGNNPTQFILPPSAGCGSGFALASASAGLAFPLSLGAGTVQTGVADNNVTAGNILIGGTVQAGRVQDSATTSRSSITNTTCVVGVALTSAAQGSAVTLLYDGVASFGTSGLVTSGSISANGPISANGAGVTSSPVNNVSSCSGCTFGGSGTCLLTFIGGGATISATGSVGTNGTTITPSLITINTNGTGYTSNPSSATLQAGSVSCTGTAAVTTMLTPGCLHMQDGLGHDTGICAPASGSSVLWNLPTAAAPGASYLVSVDGSNNLTWTLPPCAGGVPGISGCSAGVSGASSVGTITSGAASCAVTLTFSITAAHGWSCSANDQTHHADVVWQSASTTTTATLNGTVSVSDVINYMCLPY